MESGDIMVDIKHNITVNQEKKDVKDAVIQAVTDLDLIIANADTATTTQLRQAIKTLAQHQKKVIKRLVQING